MLMKDIEWSREGTAHESQVLRRISNGTGGWRLNRVVDLYWFQRPDSGGRKGYLLPKDITDNYDLFEAVCMLADFEPADHTTTASNPNGGEGDPVA